MDTYYRAFWESYFIWIIVDALVFIAGIYLTAYFIKKHSTGANILGVPYIKKTKKDVSSAQELNKRFDDCYKAIETTISPEVFFTKLSSCHDYALALMTFRVNFDYITETAPEEKFAKLRLDREWLTNEMLNRSFAKLEEDIKSMSDSKEISHKITEYFRDIDTAFKKANSLWIKSPFVNIINNPEYYLSNLYTPENLRKVDNLKRIASEKYNITNIY